MPTSSVPCPRIPCVMPCHLGRCFSTVYSTSTPRGRDKIATILLTKYSNTFSCIQMIYIFLILVKFPPKGPISNKSVVVLIMVWRRYLYDGNPYTRKGGRYIETGPPFTFSLKYWLV